MGSLTSGLVRGAIAGAAGTAALNATTYLDMVFRGRPGSSAPQQTVRRMAELTGTSIPGDEERQQARTTGIGSLLGIAAGIGAGVVTGAVQGASGRPRSWPATVALAFGVATVAGNAPMTGLAVTDPRRWSATDWAADLIPHGVYAVVTAAALRRLAD